MTYRGEADTAELARWLESFAPGAAKIFDPEGPHFGPSQVPFHDRMTALAARVKPSGRAIAEVESLLAL